MWRSESDVCRGMTTHHEMCGGLSRQDALRSRMWLPGSTSPDSFGTHRDLWKKNFYNSSIGYRPVQLTEATQFGSPGKNHVSCLNQNSAYSGCDLTYLRQWCITSHSVASSCYDCSNAIMTSKWTFHLFKRSVEANTRSWDEVSELVRINKEQDRNV